MSYEIKILNRSHNQALLALTGSRNTGSSLFNTDRGSDFFALSEELGDTTYFGILEKEKLIGAIGIARQLRMMNGDPAPVYYIFDLKVHPDWAGKPVFYRLVKQAAAHCRERENASWGFATILDTNENTSLLTRSTALLPKAGFIGKNFHVGFPLFLPLFGKSRTEKVTEIAAERAWDFYREHTKNKTVAPADKSIFFRENGFFLGCYKGSELVAVTKIADQSASRTIFLTRQPPIYFRVLNQFCKFYGCPPLPKQNQVLHLGYLSYYAAGNAQDYRKNFLHYVQKNHSGKFSYVFAGMTEREAENYKNPFLIKFTSSNYGYGSLPAGLTLDLVELTLI